MAGPKSLIFLCRHAEPDNPTGVFYGHLPGFGLGAIGIRQALGLGDFLRQYPVRGFYSSPLLRAVETARLAKSRLEGEVPIEIREDLIEVHFGKYIQGVKRWQVPVRRPLFFLHAVRPGFLPGDEPVPDMAARVDRVCQEALGACAGEAAVLVSHADPVKAFWNRYLGQPDWRFHFLDLPKGGFLELEYEGTELRGITPHQPVLHESPGQPEPVEAGSPR
jgi:broad specificity phosphatase PhoE